jgi:hypothetical protein
VRQRLLSILIFAALPACGQYAPQAGIPGSTAIPANSAQFAAWGVRCTLTRGYLNIDTPSLGFTSNGDSTDALGAPDNRVVSLGDSGVVTYTFPAFVYDGPGADFAVFENGFPDPLNDSMAFLELAFVAVSSDGVHFIQFPARSLTPEIPQIRGAGDYLDATLINNLAGKYTRGFGTPFDLSELADSPNIDVNKIQSIRVTDITGAVTGLHASHDVNGAAINDPFPTSFPTGGFDLDAIGIVHYSWAAAIPVYNRLPFSLFPNPATILIQWSLEGVKEGSLSIFSPEGRLLVHAGVAEGKLDISLLRPGLYYVVYQDKSGNRWQEKLLKL